MSDKITWANGKRKLSDLIPWPRNPRQIKGDQAKRLAEFLEEFGQVEVIAIGPPDENGLHPIYNGHQRLNVLGAKYGKDYEVEVRVSSRPLTEKEREKLTIFLHKGAAGEWDFDTLSEWDIPDLLDWGFTEVELGIFSPVGIEEQGRLDEKKKVTCPECGHEFTPDWCSHEAAKYAVEHWHYSKCMPAGKLVKVGAWEDDKFIGCVIFGRGATPEIGKPFGLEQIEICELVRVALTNHASTVSRILAISLKMLKIQSPELRLIVSFSDTGQGHHGGIYQATNWLYCGSENYHKYRVNGELYHPRTLYSRYGVGGQSIPWLKLHVDPKAERVFTEAKHKYLMPLDDAMRKQIEPLRKPYPKRGRGETDSAPQSNAETEGASPIRPLLDLTGGTPELLCNEVTTNG